MNGRSKSVVMAFAMAMAVGLVGEARASGPGKGGRRTANQRVSRSSKGTSERSPKRVGTLIGGRSAKAQGILVGGSDTLKCGRVGYDRNDHSDVARKIGIFAPGDWGIRRGGASPYDSPGDDTFKSRQLRYDSPGDDTFKSRRLRYDSPGDDT